MKTIPVNIITGFLGVGKTTAIINLLSEKTSDEQWAVVINEFGKISIDSQTLQSVSESKNIYEITGGCICCTAKGYLSEALQTIIKTGKYSRIIIEPTGLGGIDMVSEIVASQLTLSLKPIICLVDINLVNRPIIMKTPIFSTQVAKSDIVVFTKTDLISDITVLSKLKEQFLCLFPKTNISNDRINTSLLDYDIKNNKVENSEPKFSYLATDLSITNFWQKNFTFDTTNVFDTEKLGLLFRKHSSIIRAKGYIRTEIGWKLINYSLTECNFESCEDNKLTEFVIIADKSEPDLVNLIDSEILQTMI
jgi:G3E family GTPase